jgi:hypothetical protein
MNEYRTRKYYRDLGTPEYLDSQLSEESKKPSTPKFGGNFGYSSKGMDCYLLKPNPQDKVSV